MAFQVKNVALVGASGNLGVSIQDHFASRPNLPFRVSVLTRKDSNAEFSASFNIIRTDYSPESLEQSFKGQDVVIMLLPPESSVRHQTVIDAARRAGVKRFFPSEFGVRTNHPAFYENVPLSRKKWSHLKYLEKTQDVMSWTAVFCNPWIDHCVIDGLIGIYLKEKVARIYNGGDVPFSTGTRDLVPKVLVELLSNPEHMKDTENKFIHLASYTTTQNEVLKVVEKLTGEKLEVLHLKSEEVLPQAVEDLKRGINMGLGHQVQATLFNWDSNEESIGDFRPAGIWNERLDLPKSEMEQDLKGPLAGNWRGIVHWQGERLPDYSV